MNYQNPRRIISGSRRIVVKLGTRVLTTDDNTLNMDVVNSICSQLATFIGKGKQFIIVSSGAIALGLSRLGFDKRPSEINLLQAAAAVGQNWLMQAYESAFQSSKIETAQILITKEDIQSRRRYINIRNTIFTLLDFGVVPVVNENDTVSFSEIRFGDNDLISAYLSIMIDADLLLILTDTDGVYESDPKRSEDVKKIDIISRITKEIKKLASGKGSRFSSGGMESKLKASEIATRGGVGVLIANGKDLDLKAVFDGKSVGTFCLPFDKKISGKKKWIGFNPKVDGIIVVDEGGERAIVEKNKSLLPVGIIKVEGNFKIGDNVSIRNTRGEEIARGLTNFSSDELKLIMGKNTKMIPEILNCESYFEEVVHRDNMVVLVE
ncbi:MAG: glutamate 5-kinase [Spirochaetes bacterium]|nr:MAG: glutamate 5-kinase [Spirochaetota bacterium]